MDTLKIKKDPAHKSWRTGLTRAQEQALPPVGYVDLVEDPTTSLTIGVHVPPMAELVGRRLRVHHLVPGGYALYEADCVNRLGDMDFTTTVGKRYVRGRGLVPEAELTDEERALLRAVDEV